MDCSLKILANSILSIYYQYLIHGTIHMESCMLMLNFVLKKKLASKIEIERLSKLEVTCALLGKVMESRAGGPRFNS